MVTPNPPAAALRCAARPVQAAEPDGIHRHVYVAEEVVRELGQQTLGSLQSFLVAPLLPVGLRQVVIDDGCQPGQGAEALLENELFEPLSVENNPGVARLDRPIVIETEQIVVMLDLVR
jgi:hypothetical protein